MGKVLVKLFLRGSPTKEHKMAHVNTATVQSIDGNLVKVTKTSTHRDYVKVSVLENSESGEQVVVSWHLTEAAATKYIRTSEIQRIVAHTNTKRGGNWVAKVLPVVNTLTGKDAPAEAPKVEAPRSPEGDGCKCGCGTQVSGKAIYRPGHDAKHVSRLVQETKASGKQPAEAATLSPRLFAKYFAAATK
ncbi:hypothetical protein FDH62_gp53 [Arthrobacter phage Pumancara]|uniref:Uncharacterized protein n=1 Tax=Arthrobacter phage Pumancara TaxID=1772311 RepID=A0A0U4JTL8_9CAUD|nr:hypothetical protein FDH62_gp53 [Arthrobacter phage Pumancara]ALY10011.1 hypothetical protein PUMANCARA_53 [Arthrobacter phage Pumancara]